MTTQNASIMYTKVDEAPALATYSFLPIIQSFTADSGINFELRDISLSGRILANFPDHLLEDQRIPDELAALGKLAKDPSANIIKLPNISASIPQLKGAIKELQDNGYAVPDYPENPQTDAEKEIQSRYSKVLGSAVNPVLREGNSDRRAPGSVKNYAKKNPHRMGEWTADSKAHVATMGQNDFCSNEVSITVASATTATIVFVSDSQESTELKSGIALQAGEIIDSTAMNVAALRNFIQGEIDDAKAKNILFSLHMKATMMKVSDPIIFGHTIEVFFKELFEKFAAEFSQIGVQAKNGLQDLFNKAQQLPEATQQEIITLYQDILNRQPDLAMVNSDKGITCLHVPSDIIIDASMPAMIRESGKMWGPDGQLHDCKAVIPDSSYADVYQITIDNCKQNGTFDPATMGTVPNVGLMAQKAEEYGSHDKTFEAPGNGEIQIVDESGNVLLKNAVKTGDIWRMCQVKDAPIKDWVQLAVRRSRQSDTPAVFWLSDDRAHHQQLRKKVDAYLAEEDTSGLDIRILSVADATKLSVERMRQGQDTISVTGNVLRDYNTDLFPILELGTSAKMLSIVPLMNGGGLFETGAGGSAPKHVQQLLEENHLRWDSLGEFLALAASFEHFARVHNNDKAAVFAKTLDQATESYLNANKSPSRKVEELDNRGSHFYVALYWAKALSEQTDDTDLQNRFGSIYAELSQNEATIVQELNSVQGSSTNVGGYYRPDDAQAATVMQPSATLNRIVATANSELATA